MDYQSMNLNSSNKEKYIVIAIVVIIALVAWYFYSIQSTSGTYPPQESVTAPVTGSNTTVGIQADLNQVPDDSAALNQEAGASAQAVQGF